MMRRAGPTRPTGARHERVCSSCPAGLGVARAEVDRLLVSAPVNVRYLCGYTGSNGLLLIAAGERAEHRFFTDFRYVTQSAEQVPGEIEREIAPATCSRRRHAALGKASEPGARRRSASTTRR